MKITAITAQKKREGRYNVFIDDAFAFGINGVDLLYYKIKEGEELSQSRYDELMEQLSFIKAREAALNYINYKMRTEKEVRQKLASDYTEETVERVLEQFKEFGIVDDIKYAKLYINDCINLKGRGRQRILAELAVRGISRDIAEPFFEDLGDTMREKAERLMEKRIKSGSIDDMKEYKRHMDFLLRRGFDYETVKDILNKYKNT